MKTYSYERCFTIKSKCNHRKIETFLRNQNSAGIIFYYVQSKNGKMKKIIFVMAVMLASAVLIRCEKATDIETDREISFLRTVLGGCNNQGSDALKSAETEGNDTIVFTLKNDTLDVFVGLNYICCAPFASDIQISKDTVFMTLTDTCNFPDESCYCRCMCYYTWNFKFAGFGGKEYYYKIVFLNPQVENPVIFSEGNISL